MFCACHGRGDIAGCIGGLGSIRFTCPFTFCCDFHRWCFSPKKTWDDLGEQASKLISNDPKIWGWQEIAACTKAMTVEKEPVALLVAEHTWLRLSKTRKQYRNIKPSTNPTLELVVWLGDLRMKIQGPRVTLLFSLTSLMSSKQILAFLDTSVSDFPSPKTRYSFQKIQLVTNGNSNYSGRSPRVLSHQPWHGKSMAQSFWKWNPFHASKIFNHQSFLWRCLKYGTWVYSSCYRLAVCPAGTIIGRAASCPVDR